MSRGVTIGGSQTSGSAAWWRSAALVVTLAGAAGALLVTYPLIVNLDGSIYGYPGDATGTVAVYSWWEYALRHHQSIFENTMWGAPYGAGWEAVPFAVIPVIVFAPLSAFTSGTVAYNIEVLASFPLTAWATFLVARRLGCKPLGASFAALSFAFIPYHLEKAQGHAGQSHMEFFAATLFFLLRWRQGGSRWNLVGAGAVAGLTLWDDYYFAYITAFIVATFFAISVLYRQDRSASTAWLRRHITAAVVVAVVTALFVPATVLVAERPSSGTIHAALTAQAANFHQGLEEVRIYSARPLEFLLPYSANPLLPKRVLQYEKDHLHGSNLGEQALFLGYTVMLLAALAVVTARRSFATALLLGLGLVGFLVALPPGLHFGSVVVPTPSLILDPILPIFRVYSRFGIMVILAATLLAGLGLTWIQSRLTGRSALLLAVPFLLTAIEFNNVPPTHVTVLYPAPAEYQWLAQQPAGILIEYPLKAGNIQDQEIQTRQYTLYQHVHGHPIFNGATTASRADSISNQLEPYYAPGVPTTLKQIGIRYVFIHIEDYQRDGYVTTDAVPGFTYVERINGVDIFVLDST